LYCTPADIKAKYTEKTIAEKFSINATEEAINTSLEHIINTQSIYIDRKLVNAYELPLTNEHEILTDITIDLCYAQLLQSGSSKMTAEQVNNLNNEANRKLDEILNGKVILTNETEIGRLFWVKPTVSNFRKAIDGYLD